MSGMMYLSLLLIANTFSVLVDKECCFTPSSVWSITVIIYIAISVRPAYRWVLTRCVAASAIYRFACLRRCPVIGLGDWNTWSASTECNYRMRPAFLFTFCRTDCGCDARRHQRHPAGRHAAWCFNYRQAGQTHASVSKGQTGSWNLTRWFTTPAFAVQWSNRKRATTS